MTDDFRTIASSILQVTDREARLRAYDALNRMEAEYLNLKKELRVVRTECAKYETILGLIAVPKRSDGTYNRSREACEELARKALESSKKGLG